MDSAAYIYYNVCRSYIDIFFSNSLLPTELNLGGFTNDTRKHSKAKRVHLQSHNTCQKSDSTVRCNELRLIELNPVYKYLTSGVTSSVGKSDPSTFSPDANNSGSNQGPLGAGATC